MSSPSRWWMMGLLLAACGDSDTGGGKLDAGMRAPLACDKFGIGSSCGKSCTGDTDCGDALYCNTVMKCEAQCLSGGTDCGAGFSCGAHGHCVSLVPDGGDGCPAVTVSLTPVVPTVVLLIDQSGSMTMKDFKQGNTMIARWDAIKGALTDNPGGVLPTLEAKVKFGAFLYTGTTGATGVCPKLTEQAVALNNAAAIKTLMDNNPPLDNTPTGESLDAVVKTLMMQLPGPDPTAPTGPTVIALATDGDPDTCAAPNSNGTQPPKDLAIAAAKRAFSAGYPVYMLGVSNQINAGHLQDMANAGAGLPVGGAMNAPFFTATSPADLTNAFNTIIRGARTCDFKLNGQVADDAQSQGDVELDGTPLVYNDPNGWTLTDPSTLRLSGTACTQFQSEDTVMLSAMFPCGTVISSAGL